jgi:hypothetical protein
MTNPNIYEITAMAEGDPVHPGGGIMDENQDFF